MNASIKLTPFFRTFILFFNYSFSVLAGHEKAGEKGIWNHEFCFNSDYYTPLDKFYIPTGEIRPVTSDPIFDFRKPKILGDVLTKCTNQSMDASFCVSDRFCRKNVDETVDRDIR